MDKQYFPFELIELTLMKLEGALDPQQLRALDEQLASDPALLRQYVEFMALCAGLYQNTDSANIFQFTSEPIQNKSGSTEGDFSAEDELYMRGEPRDEDIIREAIESDEIARMKREKEEALRQAEAKRDEIEKAAEKALSKFKEDEKRRQEKMAYKLYKARHRRMIIGIGSLAACLIVVLTVWVHNKFTTQLPVAPPIVAKITKSIGAQWTRADLSTAPGTQLTASKINLMRGLVQVTFDSGAEVILQAPCRLELEGANQMYLQSGTLAATVPKEARGFTVRSPVATVVDYGTEFGVTVRASGETETHVFKGEVDLRTGTDTRVYEQSRRIKTGWSSTVDPNTKLLVHLIESRPSHFVREMPDKKQFGSPGERLNLADIVVGGNGFGTGKPDHFINFITGKVESYQKNKFNQSFFKSNYALEAKFSHYVNYLFVPDGGEGPVTISSTGLKFAQCPDTSGVSFCYIANGGIVRHIPGIVADLVLNRRKYGTLDHPAISMHANVGITFDLGAIRSTMPGMKIVNFNALCGVSETYDDNDPGVHDGTKTDFWVLVDGEVRASYTSTKGKFDGGYTIRIKLNDHERYLTLVVTDGSNSSHTESVAFDWGMFAEPVLELRPVRE